MLMRQPGADRKGPHHEGLIPHGSNPPAASLRASDSRLVAPVTNATIAPAIRSAARSSPWLSLRSTPQSRRRSWPLSLVPKKSLICRKTPEALPPRNFSRAAQRLPGYLRGTCSGPRGHGCQRLRAFAWLSALSGAYGPKPKNPCGRAGEKWYPPVTILQVFPL